MTHPSDDDTRIVEIYSAANEIEAGAVRAALDAEGIRARIVGDKLGNAFGEIPLGFRSEPKIWVREEDAPAALRIIEQLQDQSSDDDASFAEADVIEDDADPDAADPDTAE